MTRFTEQEFAAIQQRNPDLRVYETRRTKRPAIPVEFEASPLARRFETLWAQLGGPTLEKEYQFHPPRKWRFDYAHLETKVACELDGGIYTGGRHIHPQGFRRDAQKLNAAQLDGWAVFRFPTGDVTAEGLQMMIECIRRRYNGEF